MIDDDFLKEKQNIREKMLKYSRAVKEGKAHEIRQYELNESDRILKNRINYKKRPKFIDFDDEYEIKPKKQSSIYLKEDLINVKLEEKKPFNIKLNFFKNKKKIVNFKKKDIEHIKENKLKFSKIVMQSNAYLACKIQNLKEKQKLKTQIKQESKKKQKNEKFQKVEEEIVQEKSQVQERDFQEQNENYIIEDKYELLDNIKTEENKNLSLKNLLYAGIILFFTLLIFLPQIYIRNQIYYISRDIADLRSQEWILDEENKELQRQLEAIYFQNQVLDFLD
ncbi:hypothetical protein CINS5915_04405 [Campylobacter insulaenigrae]|uniref:hypothetical protein n=1 Tax=Campylobacter insulaenigrae TaxID=260714 RepID=UPI002152B281|nr:hypothetical protein [Campylobacter insulaenigrae]MCR6573576.1 hypothetical protein [Campylobacter insulaenigrae]MCR6575606.1 hypothetical protein [Campylobacter insulaenigrae]MCR6577039.1 hypothetical protein [Campylobacter insulaenigrae]MCR6578243.1 hypothetical protein [Campylobacter insulaenigrae]MCR6580251.1 hypothetical protein [Campylobacter insulaenigrae]